MPGDLRQRWGAAYKAHALEPSEATLHEAYELGREAVSRGMSIVEIAALHRDFLVEAAARGRASADALAAGDFLLEALSAYEMMQRAARAVRDEALAERQRATMIRRLSSLLAHESLTTRDRASLREALQLVAEQARELTGAARCVVHSDGDAIAIAVAVDAPADDGTTDLFSDRDPTPGPRQLSIPLRTLAGQEIGELEVTAKDGYALTSLQEELLVQLAEMASAAVERTRLYRQDRDSGL